MTRPTGHPVLLHGFTGCADAWGGEIVDGLAGAGLPPVLMDLPGHGRHVGATDPSLFTLTATLASVQEAGHWPGDLIGYSMGARLALHFAVAHPERIRRLVLESGSPGLATEAERRDRREADLALSGKLVDEGIEAFVNEWEAQPLFASRRRLAPEALARQRSLRLRNDPRSLAAALVGLGTGSLPSLWDALSTVTAPTLLLVGARDTKFVDIAGRMAESMADARVVVVPGAGHTVHLEQPAAWLDAVVRFLR